MSSDFLSDTKHAGSSSTPSVLMIQNKMEFKNAVQHTSIRGKHASTFHGHI